MYFHVDARSRVGTIGSGGSPYTSGSSSSRKNAPLPPTPSSGSWPYSLASVDARVVQLIQSLRRAFPQFVQRTELDRLGRAGLGAGRFEAAAQPVVAQRALVERARRRAAGRSPRTGSRTRSSRSRCRCPPARTTVPNSVRNSAPVGHTSRQPACVQCLHTSDDISQRNWVRLSAPVAAPGSSKDGNPRSTGAVPRSAPPRSAPDSADATTSAVASLIPGPVGRPRQPRVVRAERPVLLDERDVPPGVRAEHAGVVERHAQQVEPILGHRVPFLAGHLACLTADANRGVGEEPDPGRVVEVAGVRGGIRERTVEAMLVRHGSPSGSTCPAGSV